MNKEMRLFVTDGAGFTGSVSNGISLEWGQAFDSAILRILQEERMRIRGDMRDKLTAKLI